jgi:HD-GYP domain-containing protein (c-di-GMP phosphodiesterase class II)
MFAVAHPYDPMAPDRSCRKGGSHAAAVRRNTRNAAAQLDPMVVEASLPANGTGLIPDNASQPEENEKRWPTNC